jgi:hypothetical protein
MNSGMRKAYDEIDINDKYLESELLEIVSSSFIDIGECLFLKNCIEVKTNVAINDFPDKTGYECFINSVNIDDYIENDLLEQGILFSQEAFKKFKAFDKKNILNCIMLMDEFGLKIKLHLLRDGEQWLPEYLEGFEEAILMVDSRESVWP